VGNAGGGRKGVPDTSDAGKALSGVTGGAPPKVSEDKDANAGFGLDNFEKDVKGSLKVHIKLDLEVDIKIIARIKGDIAIGLL
jgi:hypothetical protein